MNKLTKGAFGVVGAAALLMGGAGSLAYWTDSANTNGGTITSGTLTLTAGTCDTNWVYAGTSTAITKIVPGDQITKSCTYTIGAVGDHISATPTIPSTVAYTVTSTPAPTTLSLNVGATYKLNGTAFSGGTGSITASNNNQTLTALITVTMPYGAASGTGSNANDTRNLTASMNNLTVSLTQDKTTSNNNA